MIFSYLDVRDKGHAAQPAGSGHPLGADPELAPQPQLRDPGYGQHREPQHERLLENSTPQRWTELRVNKVPSPGRVRGARMLQNLWVDSFQFCTRRNAISTENKIHDCLPRHLSS